MPSLLVLLHLNLSLSADRVKNEFAEFFILLMGALDLALELPFDLLPNHSGDLNTRHSNNGIIIQLADKSKFGF